MSDLLQLSVSGIEVQVLTGIYSEETHLPQPLRVDVIADLALPAARFTPDTPLSESKNYLDLKRAVTDSLPEGLHFTLIEAVADHVCATLFAQDPRVLRVEVAIVKLAISTNGEAIGIRLVRQRR
jgi:dihydroneopterin aldolase